MAGKVGQLAAAEFPAFKDQERRAAQRFRFDRTFRLQGAKHAQKFTTGQGNNGITIVNIGMFDQLKRINHEILFS